MGNRRHRPGNSRRTWALEARKRDRVKIPVPFSLVKGDGQPL